MKGTFSRSQADSVGIDVDCYIEVQKADSGHSDSDLRFSLRAERDSGGVTRWAVRFGSSNFYRATHTAAANSPEYVNLRRSKPAASAEQSSFRCRFLNSALTLADRGRVRFQIGERAAKGSPQPGNEICRAVLPSSHTGNQRVGKFATWRPTDNEAAQLPEFKISLPRLSHRFPDESARPVDDLYEGRFSDEWKSVLLSFLTMIR